MEDKATTAAVADTKTKPNSNLKIKRSLNTVIGYHGPSRTVYIHESNTPFSRPAKFGQTPATTSRSYRPQCRMQIGYDGIRYAHVNVDSLLDGSGSKMN